MLSTTVTLKHFVFLVSCVEHHILIFYHMLVKTKNRPTKSYPRPVVLWKIYSGTDSRQLLYAAFADLWRSLVTRYVSMSSWLGWRVLKKQVHSLGPDNKECLRKLASFLCKFCTCRAPCAMIYKELLPVTFTIASKRISQCSKLPNSIEESKVTRLTAKL